MNAVYTIKSFGTSIVVAAMMGVVMFVRIWFDLDLSKGLVCGTVMCGPNTKVDSTSDHDNNMIFFSV
jgi:hypothetical protein